MHRSLIQAASFIEITEDAMIDAVAIALLCFIATRAKTEGGERADGGGGRRVLVVISLRHWRDGKMPGRVFPPIFTFGAKEWLLYFWRESGRF